MPKKRLFSSLVLLATAACFASDLPKNTRLEVRLDETLGSDISQIGQDFSATLTRSISLGKESLKKGDHVSGVVKYAESTLNYYRPGEIELELTSVTSSGKVRQIATNTLRFQGKERQADPATGKQDDRGARSEDMARGAIGVVGAAEHCSIPDHSGDRCCRRPFVACHWNAGSPSSQVETDLHDHF